MFAPSTKVVHFPRNLPLLFQLTDDMNTVRGALSSALEDISRLEVGPACTKTRSVDQILEQKRVQSRSQFHSVDNMSQVSSISTGPRPDISGESGSVEMFQ